MHPIYAIYYFCTITEDIYIYQKIRGVKQWSSLNDYQELFGHSLEKYCAISNHKTVKANRIQPDGYVYLQGERYYTKCEKGDVIHGCSWSGRYDTSPSAFPILLKTQSLASDDNDLVLVVHPDLLARPTAISETIHCNRCAILMTRLGSNGLGCTFLAFFFHSSRSYSFSCHEC